MKPQRRTQQEEKHYEESGRPTNHVYHNIETLQHFIKKTDNSQSLLDEAHGVIIALLDIAEEFYPKYSSSNLIAEADDLLKKIDGEDN